MFSIHTEDAKTGERSVIKVSAGSAEAAREAVKKKGLIIHKVKIAKDDKKAIKFGGRK